MIEKITNGEREVSARVKILVYSLIAVQIILLPLIQLTDADISAPSSFASIAVISLFTVLSYALVRRDKLALRLGLLTTLVSDWFLVIKEEMLEGMLVFFIVQMLYFAYLLSEENSTRVKIFNALSRLALIGVLLIAAFAIVGDGIDALAAVSLLYYGNLLVNTVFAFLDFKKMPLLSIGFLLFALCDVCIGLDVLAGAYLDIPALDGIFYGKYYNLPWVFYQPSQVMIALHLVYGKTDNISAK